MHLPFSTVGGGVDQTAVIGHPPELRDWRRYDPCIRPEIHPSARVEALCTVDSGSFRPTRVGARSWLMKRVHLGHDVIVGEDCELAPGVTVGGEVTIGDRVKIGMNTCVRPRVVIGDGARIGCGSVVIRDVPAGETWAGNPARRIVTAVEREANATIYR